MSQIVTIRVFVAVKEELNKTNNSTFNFSAQVKKKKKA